VKLCSGGKEAIEMYGKKHTEIDLVIIDMAMGEVNGMECFREMKKINPHVKALIASGYNLNSRRDAIVSEGIAGVLHKPFESQVLAQVVADAVRPIS
jgi:DNA-binding NarL/FixJ family response regulator